MLQQADAEGCTAETFLARVFARGSRDAQREAALDWARWERQLAGAPAAAAPDEAALDALVDRYRVQSHYLAHRCWLADPPLLERCAQLPAVPTLLLHGTQDAVCPPGGSSALASLLGGRAALRWIHGAGHDPAHPAMAAAMAKALQRFAAARSFCC